ncbi:MAG: hypothetical protein RIS35_2724 [Pseudomonadota bacterium]|jgi:hypothetical protein
MRRDFAERFAGEWIDAWNAHDLDRILAHYADDFEMASPVIRRLGHAADGRLRGKAAVGAYWRAALDANPALRFELVAALAGAGSMTILYRGATGQLVAEVLAFDDHGKVRAASAHYGSAG